MLRFAFYNEVQNIWLGVMFLFKLSFTTGFIFAPFLVYAVKKLVKVFGDSSPDLYWNVGSVEEAKNERRRAA